MGNFSVAASDGTGSFDAYLVEPTTSDPHGAVVLIQEIFGVNAPMRALAGWVASLGYTALVPDLFWRQQPGVELDPDAGQTEWDRAFALMNGMDQDKAVDDLRATVAAARGMAGGNGRVGTVGFCLGGRLAFLMALRGDAECNVSYYGVGLEKLVGEAGGISAPLLLHIAGRDKFVPPEAQQTIIDGVAGNEHVTVHVYDWADHAFSRRGGHSYDERAATLADGRTAELLARVLS